MLTVSGCQAPAPRENGTVQNVDLDNRAAGDPPIVASTSTDVQTELVDKYLELARIARQQDRLTTPVDDNAYLRYLQVLSLVPDHPQAIAGIAALAEQYLVWAVREVNSGDFYRATDYTNKARSIDENHSGIGAVDALIRDKRSIEQVDYRLPTITLDTFSSNSQIQPVTDPELAALTRVAMQIDESRAPIVIFANSDALGRKIYQFLNNLTNDRISAQFELREQALVRLMIQ